MIVPLTQDNLPQFIDGLVSLSGICGSEIKAKPWTLENFF